MIERHYEPLLRRLLRRFPCVTVLGPRQCGKTTFIRAALPAWTYLDLERPSDNVPLAADPEARLSQLDGRVVFDELNVFPNFSQFCGASLTTTALKGVASYFWGRPLPRL